MNIETCILTRKSVRMFSNKKVSDKILNKIIEMGTYAPSACNFQAWKFIIIRDKKNIFENIVINRSNVSILVTYRNDLFVTGKKHYDYIQSASAAIENMLLYIHSIGLAACWICDYPRERIIKKKLNIPKNFSCIGVIALGYPATLKNDDYALSYHYDKLENYNLKKRRYNLEQIISYDKFEIKEGDCVNTTYKTLHIKDIIKDWKNIWKKM